MKDPCLKEQPWQWWEMLLIAAVLFFVVASSTCHLCGCCEVGQIQFPDLVTLILNALVVVVLGVFLTEQQSNLAKDIEGRQAKLTEDIASQQREHDAKIAEIEYLSSSNTAVRLRGIQALYQRAKDTQDSSVKEEIWSLLNSHVRHYTQDINYQKNFPREPAVDIQEAINIQGRRGEYKEPEVFLGAGLNTSVNWSDAWLHGAQLSRAQLQGARLRGTQLQGAQLWRTQLQRSHLRRAQLQVADLWNTQLQGADLWGAQLQGARLWGAQLQGAGLWGAQLQGAHSREAQFQGADLRGAQLQGARLHGARLQGARLDRARLQGARLDRAQLQGAYTYESRDGPRMSNSPMLFKKRLENRARENTELDSAVLRGGLTAHHIDEIRNELNLDAEYWVDVGKKGTARALSRMLDDLLKNHCGEEINGSTREGNELLEKQEAMLGSYSRKEANQWIEEFDEAISRTKKGVK